MTTRVPMTPAGAKALRTALDDTMRKIKVVADKIAHARGFGDLSENAEYSSAKQEQALLMKLSQTITSKLRNSHVIDPKKLNKDGKVVFGTTVNLLNKQNQETLTLTIVGEDESDINLGKISFNSPIARGIIGKMEGEQVEIQTQENLKSFKIEKVVYS